MTLRAYLTAGLWLATCACGARSELDEPCQSMRCETIVDEEPCTPSAEICNLVDDDCDGSIDEGFGFGPIAQPMILRQDEFDTGPCTSCAWAFGTTIARAESGFLAVWNLGIYGGDEQPSLFGRRMDRFGNPSGAVSLLQNEVVLQLEPVVALAPLPARGLPVEATYRKGTNVGGLLFIDSEGHTGDFVSGSASGPLGVPTTVWTGQRFISAWEREGALQVAVLNADGQELRRVELDPLERPGAITIGVYEGRVGILVSRYREPETRDQWFIVLDALGEVIEPAKPIDVAYTTWQRLVGTREGWLHIRPNAFDEASTRQPLAVSGEPLAPATPFQDGRRLQDSGLSDFFVPVAGTSEIFGAWQDPLGGDMHVEFLDARGSVLRGWSGPPGNPDGAFGDPHFVQDDDRILVVWHGLAGDAQPNPVMVRAFGCVP